MRYCRPSPSQVVAFAWFRGHHAQLLTVLRGVGSLRSWPDWHALAHLAFLITSRSGESADNRHAGQNPDAQETRPQPKAGELAVVSPEPGRIAAWSPRNSTHRAWGLTRCGERATASTKWLMARERSFRPWYYRKVWNGTTTQVSTGWPRSPFIFSRPLPSTECAIAAREVVALGDGRAAARADMLSQRSGSAHGNAARE